MRIHGHHRASLLACAGLLVGSVLPASAGPDSTYFGLQHTCIDSTQASPTQGGKLKISNLGSSGCDGVSVDLGGGSGLGHGAKGAIAHFCVRSICLPKGLTMAIDGEIGGLPGRAIAEVLFQDADSDGRPEVFVDHSAAGPQSMLVQSYLDGVLVDEVRHTPPPAIGTALAEVEDGSYKGKIKISNLGSSGCDGFSIALETDPPVLTELTGSLVVANADLIIFHADNEASQSTLIETMRIQATSLDSVIVESEGVAMWEQEYAAVGLATLEPDHKGGKLKISNLGSSGCDGVTISGGGDPDPDLYCRILNIEPPIIPPVTDNGYEFELVVIDDIGVASLVQSALRVNSGGNFEVSVDHSSIGSTSHEVEIRDGGVQQYFQTGVTNPVVATVVTPYEPFVFYDIILEASGGGDLELYRSWRWENRVTLSAGGNTYTGNELFVRVEMPSPGTVLERLGDWQMLVTGPPQVELGTPGAPTATPLVALGDAELVLRVDPNPRSAGQPSRVSFVLPGAGTAELRVVDVAGRLVSTLREGAAPAGRHELTWHGTNLRPGVYFVELNTDAARVSRKVTVVR